MTELQIWAALVAAVALTWHAINVWGRLQAAKLLLKPKEEVTPRPTNGRRSSEVT